jgi:hypothetical protein
MTQPGKAAESTPSCRAKSPQSPPTRRPHRATRVQLMTRAQLDGRTGAAKTFDRLAGEIASTSVAGMRYPRSRPRWLRRSVVRSWW